MYVPEDLVDIYKNEVIQHAFMLTPNQFECQLLSGVLINNVDDAVTACNVLHDSKGIPIIIITSLDYTPGKVILMGSAPRYISLSIILLRQK